MAESGLDRCGRFRLFDGKEVCKYHLGDEYMYPYGKEIGIREWI